VAYKWELDLNKTIFGGLAIGLIAGILTKVLSLFVFMNVYWELLSIVVLIPVLSLVTLLAWFFRDTERKPPERTDIVIAPADGTIKYIKSIKEGSIPLSSKGRENVALSAPLLSVLPRMEGYLIGIAMTFLDVHVTRAPVDGEIVFFQHIDGSFISLKKPDAPYKNERVVQVIRNGKMSLGLIHIASRLVRRIDSYVKEGDRLRLGQRIGMIRFGSQVDIVVPRHENLQIHVNVGDRVFAGVTIIAEVQGEGHY
jgi:phosphatidylserine decarboxylase